MSTESEQASVNNADNDGDISNGIESPKKSSSASEKNAANEKDALTSKEKNNIKTRWVENAKFIGDPARAAVNYHNEHHANSLNPTVIDADIQAANLIANSAGLITGWIIHTICVRYNLYKKPDPLNPFYRCFKTGIWVGLLAATIIMQFLPVPANSKIQKFFTAIITDVVSISVALFAIPYSFLSKKDKKENDKDAEENNAVIGTEGWSKYGKTLLVFFMAVGQIIGGTLSLVRRTAAPLIMTTMALWSAIAGLTAFGLGIILVPTINKLGIWYGKGPLLKANKKDRKNGKDEKDENEGNWRNSYTRTGITFGLALFSVAGFFVGSYLFPTVALASTIGMTFGGAIGSVIGGILMSVKGHEITDRVQKKWKVDPNTDNSWEYATRVSSFGTGFFGSVLGFFLGNALLGAAIGGTIGWFMGFGVIYKARQIEPEQKTQTLPWTQRLATGANIGSIIGAGVGFVIGLALGPGGALAGATLGGAIGGTVGSIAGVLSGKESRDLIEKTFSNAAPALPADKQKPIEHIINKLPQAAAATPERKPATPPTLSPVMNAAPAEKSTPDSSPNGTPNTPRRNSPSALFDDKASVTSSASSAPSSAASSPTASPDQPNRETIPRRKSLSING